MQFNSLEFVAFFGAFIALWPLLRRGRNTRWAYLVAASFFFYGWWDWRFLFLLVFSGLIDFVAGLGMERWPRRKRWLLVLSIAGNIGSLATFKYLGFGLANLNAALGWLGSDATVPLVRFALPIGISFYTFQSMSYTIDIYRGELRPTRNVLHFFAYLAMFPQLVAGPIVRAAHLLPQLEHARPTTESQRFEGLGLVVRGYFKKVVIADNLAPVVSAAFGAGEIVPAGSYWWVIAVMFAFQIYCDFSGYSDIARGLARWMGYSFPLNFDHPYVAVSFRDFWARWHISLSTWFRDYVYIPLGGSRRGAAAGHGNMWITMLLSGLWHGAAWTFVIWGALHALFLSLERSLQWPRRLAAIPGGRLLSLVITLVGVLVAWVFFRAESWSQALQIVGVMFNPRLFHLAAIQEHIHWRELLLVGLMAAWQARFYPGWRMPEWSRRRWAPILQPAAIALLLWACVFMRGPGHAFIYFQF